MTQTDLTGGALGGYRILRKLGQGGMAVVYKAHEESLNRVVALKVIAQHLSDNEQFITRFKREAQAAAQLSHPNIVQIYAIGEDDGVHFFAMEYVKGRSLSEIIEEEGFLTAGRAVPIITQAAEALAVAHEAGIVHRDIKPANIMLDAHGRVKVADFGIAQMATETRMTQSGMLVGTPEFISPEQCHNEKLDGRSDIYSLGVTFYQLLSGRTPFEADTPASLVLQIVDGPIPPVGQLNPTIPTGVQAIVAKMMHVDRNQRFQGAEDLIHALKAVSTQPNTSTTQPLPGAGVAAHAAAPTVPAPREPTAIEPGATKPMRATAALPHTEAMPAGATPAGSAAAGVEAAAGPSTDADNAAAPPRPSTPAAEAYAGGKRRNQGALLGLAAMVLIIVTVAIFAWQLMGDSNAADRFDPATEARPRALPERQQKVADDEIPAAGDSGRDIAETAESAASEGELAATVSAPAGRADDAAPTTTSTDDARGVAAGTLQAGDTQPSDAGARGAGDPQPAATGAQQAAAQQQPPPPAPAESEVSPAFVPPPVNSIVAETTGEYEYVDQVQAWIERAFGGQSFQVVDYPSSPYGSLQEAARFHVVTTAKLVSTQQLEYFGNSQTQYTVALISRVIDLGTSVTVIGPENKTIQYTAINMQQNLERGTNELASAMARELRQAIRVP